METEASKTKCVDLGGITTMPGLESDETGPEYELVRGILARLGGAACPEAFTMRGLLEAEGCSVDDDEVVTGGCLGVEGESLEWLADLLEEEAGASGMVLRGLPIIDADEEFRVYRRASAHERLHWEALEAASFGVGGYFGGHAVASVERVNGKLLLEVATECRSPEVNAARAMGEDELAALCEELDRCGAQRWAPSYYDPCVLDGTQWDFEAFFSDGAALRSTGSNEYPRGFARLVRAFAVLGLPEDPDGFEERD